MVTVTNRKVAPHRPVFVRLTFLRSKLYSEETGSQGHLDSNVSVPHHPLAKLGDTDPLLAALPATTNHLRMQM